MVGQNFVVGSQKTITNGMTYFNLVYVTGNTVKWGLDSTSTYPSFVESTEYLKQ